MTRMHHRAVQRERGGARGRRARGPRAAPAPGNDLISVPINSATNWCRLENFNYFIGSFCNVIGHVYGRGAVQSHTPVFSSKMLHAALRRRGRIGVSCCAPFNYPYYQLKAMPQCRTFILGQRGRQYGSSFKAVTLGCSGYADCKVPAAGASGAVLMTITRY
ncbi:hypothetical protein EVAR_62443_1 [Eumeta japonica]|uniref:Uncharacterized protein n=1 Tax=Eumeta variegata TaxID=151549 RepID=A0A4C1YWZ1_EUMVA|nr:hypothetical protein EVAR_62443_1 [Eumeta japonica]